ncbi:DUF1456 family protein, partial [Pseudomonadales bacterium]|nr:DUF1456 family protein [Pseudomonadales bacterium]
LSAFFRKSSHKHFRKCQDQVLRHFLKGLQATYRPDTDNSDYQENQINAPTPDLASVETHSADTEAMVVEPEVQSVWRRKKP